MAKKKSPPKQAASPAAQPGAGSSDSRMMKANTYEELATIFLNLLRTEFGLDRVEPKQSLPGKSGATWRIDAKGVKEKSGGTVVVECRRKSRDGITQEEAAALAWRITDLSGVAGIFVSPIGLQEGAEKVAAAAADIIHVTLNPNSTPQSFAFEFLGKFRSVATVPFFISGIEAPEPAAEESKQENREEP